MTRLLEKAFAVASKLPPHEQDIIANHVLEELESEKLWSETLASSQDVLESLAAEALSEHRTDKTEDLDPDQL